ncbi:MAG: AAA family ATPase [Armatimonadota bacterium]|nr:AAA family ATPase [Armatimonadota bacterium]
MFHLFDEVPARPRDFLVQDLLPYGYVALLAGHPKAGKTAFASALATAIADGIPFAGLETRQSPVLWFSLEEDPGERGAVMQERLVNADTPEIYTNYEPFRIDDEADMAKLSYWLTSTRAKLIVVDPLYAAHASGDLKSGWSARRAMRGLKRLCAVSEVSALVLHHMSTRGPRKAAESAQLSAIASTIMLLSSTPTPADPDDLESQARIVTVSSRGRGAFANREWHFLSKSPLHYEQCAPPKEFEYLSNTVTHRHFPLDAEVLKYVKRGVNCTASQIAADLQHNPQSVRNALLRLRSLGSVREVYRKSNTTYYNLPLPDSDEPSDTDRNTCK